MQFTWTTMVLVRAVLCISAVLCSGTVVRAGPGKYDQAAEGNRKPMTVKPGDKVRVLGGSTGNCLPSML
jgi:hypothetical protein